MSPTIFAIAATPAAVVYFVGLLSKNRSKTLIAAIAMALLGLVTGSPAYIFTDVFFVAVAYLWTSGNFTATAKKVNLPASPPARGGVTRTITEAGNKAKEVLVALVQAALIIGAFFLILASALIWYNSTQETADTEGANRPTVSVGPIQSPSASPPNINKFRQEEQVQMRLYAIVPWISATV